jgi:hypothetical protein
VFIVFQGNFDSYVHNLGLAFWAGHIGLNTLFAAALLGLIATGIYSIQGNSKWLKRLIASVLALIASYYALELPFISFLMRPSTTFFAYSYAVQAIFTVPLMIVLAFKVLKNSNFEKESSIWTWGGLTFAGFIVALWANVMMRWFDMIASSGISFLVTGIISLGFLDSAILMSSALFFSLISVFYFFRKKVQTAMKWVALSLITVGLHYVIYTIYSYYANVLSFVLLVDVWTIPFLGLGIFLLIAKKRVK